MMDKILCCQQIKSVIKKSSWKIVQFISVTLALCFISQSSFAATTHSASAKNNTSQHSSQNHSAHTHKKKNKLHGSKKSRHHHLKKNKPQPRANIQSAQTALPEVDQPARTGFMATMEDRLVNFVHETVAHLRYSVYKLGGSKFDTSRGVYIVDCSNYVDRVLENVYPNAYSSLVDWSGADNPTTHDYYNFFTALPDSPKYSWSKVDDVEQLRAGDVLVFRYKNSSGNETGGHVMIVMDKPTAEDDAFLVRVADSASGGHSADTRQRNVSGIGIGTLLLKKDPRTYQPSAFAWRVGSQWKHNVNFAMARPVEVS